MTVQPNYIVFQCYGNEAIFHECAFALLSLSFILEAEPQLVPEVWIYTDKPGWFSKFSDCPLQLRFRQIDKETLQKWRGAINFVHRVKIEILLDFTTICKGNILYADTDVIFTAPISAFFEAIEKGHLFMHTPEGRVCDKGNPVISKLYAYLVSGIRKKSNGKELSKLYMWNAGVLGFHSGFAGLLSEVLNFTDEEYPDFPRHIVEQFAFSIFFSGQGALSPASPYLVHYWNLKEVRPLLAAFFLKSGTDNWGSLQQKSRLLQMPVLMQEKGNFYQNRSMLAKLRKEKWEPVNNYW